MKIPYIKFIETLAIGKLRPDQIVIECRNLSLGELPIAAAEVIVKTLKKNYDEYFSNTDPVDPIILNELRVEKLYSHWFQVPLPKGTIGIEGAYRIVNDPLMYRLITSMALANIDDEDIELIVNGKYNFSYATEDIVEFLHYFFNTDGWTLVDKKQFADNTKNPDLRSAYKLAIKGDKDYLLWKLGAAPEKPFDEMLKDMMVDSYYNFKERAKADPDMAQKWGALAVKITDRLEKLEKETNDRKDMFADIEFQIQSDDGRHIDRDPLEAAMEAEKEEMATPPHIKVKMTTKLNSSPKDELPHIEDLK